MNVEIEYCVPCGHLDRAIATQRDLLETFGRRLDTVGLRTGHGGVFTIRIDDREVLDAKREGYDLEQIRTLVAEALSARPDGAGDGHTA